MWWNHIAKMWKPWKNHDFLEDINYYDLKISRHLLLFFYIFMNYRHYILIISQVLHNKEQATQRNHSLNSIKVGNHGRSLFFHGDWLMGNIHNHDLTQYWWFGISLLVRIWIYPSTLRGKLQHKYKSTLLWVDRAVDA